MAVTDNLVPYEILIRFGDDGTPRGAHVQYRRVVTVDGEVIKNDPLPAEPITLEGLPSSSLMQEVTLAALARVTELEALLAEPPASP